MTTPIAPKTSLCFRYYPRGFTSHRVHDLRRVTRRQWSSLAGFFFWACRKTWGRLFLRACLGRPMSLALFLIWYHLFLIKKNSWLSLFHVTSSNLRRVR